jgi:predicted amidohydrolase
MLQTNPRLGDLQTNLEDHLARIDRAVANGAELICFPELSLTGYFLKDQVDELAQTLDAPIFEPLLERSLKASIVVGFVERSPSDRLYDSIAFLERGEILGVHRKVHLVSYGMFDEARDFAAGEHFRIIESRLGRFGPLICEDLWHTPSAYLHFLNDADYMLIPSASPARGVEAPGPGLSSQRTWNTLLEATAILYRTWVLYAGRVGWEDGVGFGGSSAVYDPFGERQALCEGFEPAMLETTIDPSALRRARVETPLRRDEKPWVLAAELERTLRNFRGQDAGEKDGA